MYTSILPVYERLWLNYEANKRFVKVDMYRKLAVTVWNSCSNLQVREEEEIENIYCHSFLLVLQRISIAQENSEPCILRSDAKLTEERINDIVGACIMVTMCIIFHIGDKVIQFPELTSGLINEISDIIITTPPYFPSAMNYLELLQEYHQILSPSLLTEARRIICIAYGSEFILLLSPLELAVSSIILVQLLHNPEEYKRIPNYDEASSNQIEILYQCVLSSSLSTLVTSEIKIIFSSLVLEKNVEEEELLNLRKAFFSTRSQCVAGKTSKSIKTRKKCGKRSRIESDSISSESMCEGKNSLGKGSSGDVVKVKSESGRTNAQKEQAILEIFIKEVILTSALNHENIQTVLSFDISNRSFQMPIQAYTLEYEIDNNLIDSEKCRMYSRQILSGVSYIHSYGMMHGDLKESNILVAPDGTLKISDMGGSIGFVSTKSYPSKYGTLIYMPRELFESEEAEYGQNLDIWSCGIVILIMVLGKPFRQKLIKKLSRTIENISYDNAAKYTQGIEKDLAYVIRQCLSFSSYRITAAQALCGLAK